MSKSSGRSYKWTTALLVLEGLVLQVQIRLRLVMMRRMSVVRLVGMMRMMGTMMPRLMAAMMAMCVMGVAPVTVSCSMPSRAACRPSDEKYACDSWVHLGSCAEQISYARVCRIVQRTAATIGGSGGAPFETHLVFSPFLKKNRKA